MPGTVVETIGKRGNLRLVTLTCTADAADASFPSTALSPFSGRLVRMTVNPGATAPTNLYDAVITDEDSVDILQGLGANLLTATTEDKAIVYSGTEIHPLVHNDNTLTLAITNNSVNSAITVIKLYFERLD